MILNFTQYPATPDQVAEGVMDLVGNDLAQLKRLLTFETTPDRAELLKRARSLAELACDVLELDDESEDGTEVMIGGPPFFMSTLEQALREQGLQPIRMDSKPD